MALSKLTLTTPLIVKHPHQPSEFIETGSESTSEDLKIQFFSGGACPQIPLVKCALCKHIVIGIRC